MAQDDAARRFPLVIELRDKAFEQFARLNTLVMPGKEHMVTPVLPGPEKDDLHAALPCCLVQREQVGFVDRLRIDPLLQLDMGERANAVTQARGLLEVELRRRELHLLRKAVPNVIAPPLQEVSCLVHELPVFACPDLSDARGRAALDLEQKARTRSGLEDRIRAAAQQEGALERVQRPPHGAGRGKRSEIVALPVLRTAMLDDLRRFMVARDEDVRKRLVVAQQHIVARLQALDEIGLEQERLDLRRSLDELHGDRVRDHARNACRLVVGLGIGLHTLAQA